MKHVKSYRVFESYVEATKSSTSPERLAEILLSPNSSSLAAEAAAANPNVPVEALIKASTSEWGAVRQGVAINRKTPAVILDELSRDDNSDVRYRVAQNHSTPTEIIVKLSQDENESVRKAALKNPNMPEDLTDWVLSGSDSWL